MAHRTISINRAPVLTLWAAVVAQRLGFDEDEALTMGKAVAGLNAQTKGRSLGIFTESDTFYKLLVRRREQWPEKYRGEFVTMARTCIERMVIEDDVQARLGEAMADA
jgi:hypothetical protein